LRYYRWFVSRLDGYVAQTRATAAELAQATGIAARTITLIPNPCRIADEAGTIVMRVPRAANLRLLCVGSFKIPKGYDRMLPAFASLRRAFPRATLRIAG